MVDDTSSDDQEVIHLEDLLLENIDMLSDKRWIVSVKWRSDNIQWNLT